MDEERREAWLYDLTVDPEHRRNGHASAAFPLAFTQARELGARRIGLRVFASNVPARAFYARMGFRETSLYMARRLEIPAA